ncbi:MAG: redoxin family protein [Luteitalea sp.]|nr:redoxin family protein [Luteitalea sp.]
MRTFSASYLGLALLISACGGSPDRREYTLQGQILTVAPDHKEANIKHEEIPGFMAAMTMPYKALDAKEFEPLAPGDLINATLVVVSNDAYLQNVKKVGNAPLEQPAAAPSASSGFELLKDGEPVPNARFLDQDGTAIDLASLKGKAVVVTFIYTSCPLPTFCPLMDRHFATMQARLKEKNNDLNVQLLSVSFDPVTDTPAVLKKHAAGLKADPRIWTFVTGDRDELDQWASRFGVSVSRSMNDPKDITHNLRTAVIDRQGNLVRSYTGNEWTPEQVLADVRVMVGVD